MGDILTQLQELLPYAEETTLNYYILQATQSFLNLTNQNAVPPNAYLVIISMVLELYNQMGYEGLSTSNTGGVSYTLQTNYSPRVMQQISQYRRIAW